MTNLTRRELEIAELFAWGAAKKEVADMLYISERTVENHARNIYEKVGCSKVNELAAWWFCTRFHISFDLSPLKRKVIAISLLFLIAPQIYSHNNEVVRQFRSRTSSIRNSRPSRRRQEQDFLLEV